MYCEEKDRSWCSSSPENDHRAITIECASDTKHPYTLNNKVYEALIVLCVDICKRYGKKKLLWLADKNKTLAYKPAKDEMIITVHRWFANKACPGDWLYSRLGDLASTVTKRLGGTDTKPQPEKSLYRVQTGAFSKKENATAMVSKLKAAGFDAFITTEQGQSVTSKSLEEIAREVIQGKWGNGAERKARLEAAGYDYAEVQAKVNTLV